MSQFWFFSRHLSTAERNYDVGNIRAASVDSCFCQALGATVSLSSSFHPQTSGQTERPNQDLESVLCCVTASNPSSWTSYLAWIEYVHNSMTSAATGMFPFGASLGYHQPLFPFQESELAVPSVQNALHCSQIIWKNTQWALLYCADSNKCTVARYRIPAQPGQMV